MWQVAGIVAAVGLGLAWGWASGRMFGRPLVQDVAAVSGATMLGWMIIIVVHVARLSHRSSSGLGAVSGGVSEPVLFVLPATVLLALGAHVIRPHLGQTDAVPVVLGGLGALVGAVWVASTVHSSID